MKSFSKILGFTAIAALIVFGSLACGNGTIKPYSHGEDTITPHRHTWSANWQVDIPATCMEPGREIKTCSGCNEIQKQEIAIDPNAHDYQPAPGALAPTCTEDGYGGQICAHNDEHTVEVGVIPKLNHAHPADWTSGTAATCTTASTRIKTCTRDGCNETVETDSTAALDHLPNIAAATCTTAKFCTRTVNGCGGIELEAKNASNHAGGEKNGTTVLATCTATGSQQILCNGCNVQLRTETLPINASNHAGGEKNGTTVLATCTATGSQQTLCNGCNVQLRIDIILPISHTYTSSHVCDVCHHSYAIGDTGPGGGKIFYVADGQSGRPLGFTVEAYTGTTGSFAQYTACYFEAAPGNFSGTFQWGDYGTTVADATVLNPPSNNNIGKGRKDTMLIAAHMNGKSIENTAAQICAAYDGGGKSDWFLPSLGELNQLYVNRNAVGNLGANYFWSSSQLIFSGSQLTSTDAWIQSFINGGQDYYRKTDTLTVRAIRAF